MKYQISLSATGGLALHLPSGRVLEFSATIGGLQLLQETLQNAENPIPRPRYIGGFPTQQDIDNWKKAKKQEETESFKEKYGIDVNEIKFTL